ncbi:MAG: malto-oligosyltrehalose synthase, partial [Verrucomicrobia bacterium]
AVRETIACFPVYRTYLEPGKPVSPEDRAVIERAVAAAKRRNPAIEESVFNFLRDLLLFRFPENLDEEQRAAHAQFVLKFQQFTGPIMAKGVEDTVFYIYNRLAALNEVGGEPHFFGLSVEAFHQRNLQRQRDWPDSLVATSTHDTKRSEDVRARMLAISEIPQLWGRSLQKWRTANRRFKKQIDEAEAPDADEEYLLYQTLLGAWPINVDGVPAASVSTEFVSRIQGYMAKALKEAKLNTSWIQPNENWDNAMGDFVARILEESPRNKFLPAFLPVAEEIARLGAINSLAQITIKFTAPGVPDVYQGTELWDDSLVDPDNRRPVDYARRRKMLKEVEHVPPSDLMRCWANGRIGGAFADCAIGFVRRHQDRAIVVMVPRLSSRVGFPPVGESWQDTHANLASGPCGLHDVFSDRELRAENSQLKLSEAMLQLPFAVFTNS